MDTPAEHVNPEKSLELARQVIIKNAACFQNALRVLRLLDWPDKVIFAVGLVIHRIVEEDPNEHAWLEIDGEIIDPTYAIVAADDIENVFYSPLFRFAGPEARKRFEECYLISAPPNWIFNPWLGDHSLLSLDGWREAKQRIKTDFDDKKRKEAG